MDSATRHSNSVIRSRHEPAVLIMKSMTFSLTPLSRRQVSTAGVMLHKTAPPTGARILSVLLVNNTSVGKPPDFHRTIVAAGGEQLAIHGKGDGIHRPVMPPELAQQLIGRRVENPNLFMATDRLQLTIRRQNSGGTGFHRAGADGGNPARL